jgi:competence protein ComEC
MQRVPLFQTKKERLFLMLVLILVFLANIGYKYRLYKEITNKKFYETKALVLNQYEKNGKIYLRLKSRDFIFFTSTKEKLKDLRDRKVVVSIIKTRYQPSFFKFLKGAYFVSYIKKVLIKDRRYELKEYIASQHSKEISKEIFPALFLATAIEKKFRKKLSALSLSHLVAISGYHLSILVAIVMFIFIRLLKPLWQKFFPYLNINKYALIFSVFVAFLYILFNGATPSLVRSLALLAIGIFLYDRHIKLLSFELLFWVGLTVLVLFPDFLFSLGFWFSMAGVFYIFLFVNSFKFKGIWSLVFLNIWLYLMMVPIVHFFFYDFSYYQLLSPFITMAFSIFYPISLILHIFGFGGVLEFLVEWIDGDFSIYTLKTPAWYLYFFIFLSLLSVFKRGFVYLLILLNFLFLVYNMAKL